MSRKVDTVIVELTQKELDELRKVFQYSSRNTKAADRLFEKFFPGES
jgi:hypothetical protein